MLAPASEVSGRRLVWAALFFLGVAVLWSALFTTARFEKRDAYDYAQLGRQIHSGEGFTTRQIFPRYIPYLHDKGYLDEENWPSLHRYPGLPTAAAFFQLFREDIIEAAVVETGVFFLLGVPLLFLLAARLTDLRVASLAVLVYVGEPRIVRCSYNGMTETLAILLLLLLAHVLFRPPARQGQADSWLLAGLLCGLMYLTRTQLVYVLPVVMLFALTQVERRRVFSILLLFGGLIATVSPWLTRNFLVVGDPLFSFNSTRAFLARTESFHRIDLVLDATVSFSEMLRESGDEVVAKIWSHLWPTAVDPGFWYGVLGIFAICIPLFLVGSFSRRPVGSDYLLFERSVMLLTLANFLMVSTTYHRPRYYETLFAFLVIVLARRIWWLVEWLSSRRPTTAKRWQTVAAALLFTLAGARAVATWADHATRQPASDLPFRALAEMTSSEDVIVSDLSLEITLHNGNRTVRLPSNPDDVLEINRRYLPLDVLVVSEHVAQRQVWRQFLPSERFLREYQPMPPLPNRAQVFRRTTSHQTASW